MVFGLFRRRSPDSRVEEKDASSREARLGPEPSPPRSSSSPGLRVLRLPEPGESVPTESAIRPFSGESMGSSRSFIVSVEPDAALPFEAAWAAVVLSGALAGPEPASVGDFLTGDASGARRISGAGSQPAYVLAHVLEDAETPFRKVGRDDLSGTGFRGIAGIRALHRGRGFTAIRMGPPPGARWVIVGLSSLALLSGKLTLIDGETPHGVVAGQTVFVMDPSATLYLQAGNDSALALGFANGAPVVGLG